jgi:hypothetical protein
MRTRPGSVELPWVEPATKAVSSASEAHFVNDARHICARSYHFVVVVGRSKSQNPRVKYWELVADKLSKAGWSLGWVSAIDSEGRTIWIVDAHRDNGKRFVVRSDELRSAFLELEDNAPIGSVSGP